METLATASVQLGNGDICVATHIVGDCLFKLGDKSWSFSDMQAKELSFDDIVKSVLADQSLQSLRDDLSQFMLDNYYDYMALNHI